MLLITHFFAFSTCPSFFAGDDVGDKGYYAYWGSQGDNVRLAYSTFDLAFDHDDTKSWYFEQGTFDCTLYMGNLPNSTF